METTETESLRFKIWESIDTDFKSEKFAMPVCVPGIHFSLVKVIFTVLHCDSQETSLAEDPSYLASLMIITGIIYL